MPASVASVVRKLASVHRHGGTEYRFEDDSKRSISSSRSPTARASARADTKPPKKKKASNAFFLYRSYVLANKLLPADITHQNDASRVAAQMWKAESQNTRTRFFAMAEERKKEQEEEHEAELTAPSSPVSSFSSSTSSTCVSPPTSPQTPYSSYLSMPATPRIYTRELPASSSMTLLFPFWELAPVFKPEEIPEPNHDEPLLFALSDEWSSPDVTSSLSLIHNDPRGDAWSRDNINALGLYFSQ